MDPEYYCSVHTSVDNWKKSEDAAAAVHKERMKLEERGAWNLQKARHRDQVEEESRRL